MSSGATFTEVRLGIMGGYIHAVTWQIVDTRQVALLLIFIMDNAKCMVSFEDTKMHYTYCCV